MTSIYDNPDMQCRYTLHGATTVDEVLNAVPCIDDTKHPEIPFEFHGRRKEVNSRIKHCVRDIGSLENGMDRVVLSMYLIEFWGYGKLVRENSSFLEKMMFNIPKRYIGTGEKTVLLKFSSISRNHDAFKEEILKLRQSVNGYWKEIFVDQMNSGSEFLVKAFKYRHTRINALKSVYGDEWTEWIWRIIDIDELALYYFDTCPVLREHQENLRKQLK